MNNYSIWLMITCLVGLVAWRAIRIKTREIAARAEFYEHLCHLWKCISDSGHWGFCDPCVDKALAYINSVSKKRRGYIREEVHKLLDSGYQNYLLMLEREMNRYLGMDDSRIDRDESLHIFFVQNHRWLEIEETECDWYNASKFCSQKRDKTPNRVRKILTDEWSACDKRLAGNKAAAEERALKWQQERANSILAEQRAKGFWLCMAEIGPMYIPSYTKYPILNRVKRDAN